MQFRDMDIDDVIVIGPRQCKDFTKEIKELHEKYKVIDLQYSVTVSKWGTVAHYALALVANPEEEEYEE